MAKKLSEEERKLLDEMDALFAEPAETAPPPARTQPAPTKRRRAPAPPPEKQQQLLGELDAILGEPEQTPVQVEEEDPDIITRGMDIGAKVVGKVREVAGPIVGPVVEKVKEVAAGEPVEFPAMTETPAGVPIPIDPLTSPGPGFREGVAEPVVKKIAEKFPPKTYKENLEKRRKQYLGDIITRGEAKARRGAFKVARKVLPKTLEEGAGFLLLYPEALRQQAAKELAPVDAMYMTWGHTAEGRKFAEEILKKRGFTDKEITQIQAKLEYEKIIDLSRVVGQSIAGYGLGKVFAGIPWVQKLAATGRAGRVGANVLVNVVEGLPVTASELYDMANAASSPKELSQSLLLNLGIDMALGPFFDSFGNFKSPAKAAEFKKQMVDTFAEQIPTSKAVREAAEKGAPGIITKPVVEKPAKVVKPAAPAKPVAPEKVPRRVVQPQPKGITQPISQVAYDVSTKKGVATPGRGAADLTVIETDVGRKGVPKAAEKIHEEFVTSKQVRQFDAGRDVNRVIQGANEKERELIPFLIEGKKPPKQLNRPDLEKMWDDPKVREKLKPVVKDTRNFYKKMFKDLVDVLPEMSDKEIENYVTHIWDIPKKKIPEAVNWFKTTVPFAKKRSIDTYAEGIKLGYKPRTLDAARLMNVYSEYVIKATENMKFAQALKKLQTENGIPLIVRAGKQPEGWIQIDHPALRRALYIPGKEDVPAKLLRVPVYYHPSLKPMMDAVFQTKIRLPGKWGTAQQAYESVNALLKQAQLSISLFHHMALGETAVATIGGKRTAQIVLDARKIYKALAKRQFDIYESQYPIARDGIQHGLQIGAISDVQRGMVNEMLLRAEKTLEKGGKALAAPVKLARKGKEMWDSALWDYFHNQLKLYGYENLTAKEIARRGKKAVLSPDEITGIKKEVAQFVNDTFGGQNWERLMTDPRSLQVAQWFLLSPDWTMSTLKQAMAPTGVGAIGNDPALRRRLGRNFWAKAALYFGLGMNMLNMSLTKRDDANKRGVPFRQGKGKWMWENDPGHETHLFIGRYEDGKKRYLRWGKQFRELPELFYDAQAMEWSPITAAKKKIGGKAAPALQTLSILMTKSSLSEFRNKELDEAEGWKWARVAAEHLATTPLPFSFRSSWDETKEFKMTDLFAPSSKGMTYYKARKMFKRAILERKPKAVMRIFRAAYENNLSSFEILEDAMMELRKEADQEVREDIKRGKIPDPKTLRELEQSKLLKARDKERIAQLEAMDQLINAVRARYDAFHTEQEIMEKEREQLGVE